MMRSTDIVEDITPITNLTKRIFIAFYKNCGSQDHFMESVSLRFAREIYRKSDGINIESVSQFIEARFSMKVEIISQKDEMFFDERSTFEELLAKPTKNIPEDLHKDEYFLQSFKNSVLRKNQTFGETENGYKFAIKTFSEEYFVSNDELAHITIKMRPKFCIVYYSKGQRLNIDEIYHSNRIISIYFQFREIHDRETFLQTYNIKTLEIEERASDDPYQTKDDLKSQERTLLTELLNSSINITDASGYIYYEYDVFADSFIPSIWSRFEGSPMPIEASGDSPYHRALETMAPQDIWHPEKLGKNIDEIKKRGKPGDIDRNEALLLASKKIEHVQPIGKRAAWIAPVVQGRVVVGLVEFYAHDVSRLTPDESALNSAAYSAGEALRRIELANDRGWLAKMSYVHAARHSLENVRRRLTELDTGLAEELVSSFQTDEESFFDPPNPSSPVSGQQVQRVLLQRLKTHYRDLVDYKSVQEVTDPLQNVTIPSSQVANTIIDVFDTIFSNSRHSPLQVERLDLSIDKSRNAKLILRYLPHQVRIPISDAHKIFVSPIRAPQSPTYHYGLFLCGAQVRMLGGCAAMIADDDIGLGNSSFGISFTIPLGMEGIKNESEA